MEGARQKLVVWNGSRVRFGWFGLVTEQASDHIRWGSFHVPQVGHSSTLADNGSRVFSVSNCILDSLKWFVVT